MKLTHRQRQVLAVLAVTTALCADRATAAAPTPRPQASHLAGRIVDRLTRSFGRTIADASRVQPRQPAVGVRTSIRPTPTPIAFAPASHLPLSPFQFRLPPPTL